MSTYPSSKRHADLCNCIDGRIYLTESDMLDQLKSEEETGQLRSALAEGWETFWLRVPNGPHLAFRRPVRVRLEYLTREQCWIAELPKLLVCGHPQA